MRGIRRSFQRVLFDPHATARRFEDTRKLMQLTLILQTSQKLLRSRCVLLLTISLIHCFIFRRNILTLHNVCPCEGRIKIKIKCILIKIKDTCLLLLFDSNQFRFNDRIIKSTYFFLKLLHRDSSI